MYADICIMMRGCMICNICKLHELFVIIAEVYKLIFDMSVMSYELLWLIICIPCELYDEFVL